MTATVSPMFPLGSVLFPYGVLPLHVFEPRYRLMTERCLAGDGTFGVVLIERGSEVGGGDMRFDVGTLARIVEAGRFDDGRYALVAVGVRRVRVQSWLSDDPYPQAEVEVLDDDIVGGPTPPLVDAASGVSSDIDRQGRSMSTDVEQVARLLERVRALHAELGAPVASTAIELSADDPARASFEAASLAPIGPLDAQALLETDAASDRLARLLALLTEETRVLEFRLSGG
ncbi:MAG TPA: LON peptidase substrate-binding domain-containing protein [Acidimicrobiia bacterium]|jgi:Lon protease-like protein